MAQFRKFTYGKLSKYPHMLGGDVSIWERFIEQNPYYFDHVAYDIHVGEGQPISPEWEPNIQVMAKSLTQRRIDVLGFNLEKLTIVEVKVQAGTSAIGQLVCYRQLFNDTFNYQDYIDLLLITDLDNRDVKKLCSHFSIKYVVI